MLATVNYFCEADHVTSSDPDLDCLLSWCGASVSCAHRVHLVLWDLCTSQLPQCVKRQLLCAFLG